MSTEERRKAEKELHDLYEKLNKRGVFKEAKAIHQSIHKKLK